MRFSPLVVLALLAACAQEPDLPVRRLATDTQEIQGGTVDTTSTNVVGIIFNTSQGAGICSGSLIAPNLVLTARHCVGPTNTTQCSTNGFGAPYAA
ncbi:MAG TPA: trypsin-like serine protease, partial [Archangium sp.]